MNIVIIEDEVLVVGKLEKMIFKYNSEFKVLEKLGLVEVVSEWFV